MCIRDRWDRANALYKRRSDQVMSHQSAAEFHNRYPYSGKIICEEHGTSFYRQVLKSAKGEKEVWQCRVYRDRGRAACSAPQLRTTELDQIMAQIFNQLAQNKQTIVDSVVKVIQSVPDEHDYERDILRIEEDLSAIHAKKDRLLEMSMAEAITIEEFKRRNDGFNEQIKGLEKRLKELNVEEQKCKRSVEQMDKIKTEMCIRDSVRDVCDLIFVYPQFFSVNSKNSFPFENVAEHTIRNVALRIDPPFVEHVAVNIKKVEAHC